MISNAVISGGPNISAVFDERRRNHHQQQRRKSFRRRMSPQPAMNKARSGAPALCHLIAVETGHDRGRLTGNAHQDRCGRAATTSAPP